MQGPRSSTSVFESRRSTDGTRRIIAATIMSNGIFIMPASFRLAAVVFNEIPAVASHRPFGDTVRQHLYILLAPSLFDDLDIDHIVSQRASGPRRSRRSVFDLDSTMRTTAGRADANRYRPEIRSMCKQQSLAEKMILQGPSHCRCVAQGRRNSDTTIAPRARH